MQIQNTRVKELMETALIKIGPEDTLSEACKKMKESDCGCLPVGTGDKVEGIITDRDIVIRAIAAGRDPAKEKVRDYMSKAVHACRHDDAVAAAAKKMCEHGISRLIVTDGSDKACGILSFGKIIRNLVDDDEMTEVIACATGRKWQPQESPLSGNARRAY